MITKAQLIASMRHETEVIKHLATKIPEGQLDWRPTPAQRSIRELLQYMPVMALSPTLFSIHGDWEHSEALQAESETVTPENFAERMDAQLARIEEALADLDEAAATDKPSTMPWGTPVKQSQGLMDMPLKCLVAYRMQLFLYAKQAGNSDIGPPNCWAGVVMPPQAG